MRRAVLVLLLSVGAGCGDDDNGARPAPRPSTEDRVVRALDDAGYYDATNPQDRRAVVRELREVCDRLDAERENDTRYEYLVSFFRSDSGIGANAGWPNARIATVAMPILCPAHQQVLDRAVGTVS